MIQGEKLTPLRQIIDERGKVMHMLREDSEIFDHFGEIYFTCTNPGAIKAWHLHKKMTLNCAVIFGQIKCVLYDDRPDSETRGQIDEIFLSPENYKLVAEMLGGYMAGVTVSGVLWAIFQNNAGGAWDNAKKSFEAGVEINGVMTYKGSDAHKAAVTGDTVGDPFKDTSGPSMNILIKLTCLIGLVIAPILGGHSDETTNVFNEEIEVNVHVENDITEKATASVSYTTNENGVETVVKKSYYGSEEEVEKLVSNKLNELLKK